MPIEHVEANDIAFINNSIEPNELMILVEYAGLPKEVYLSGEIYWVNTEWQGKKRSFVFVNDAITWHECHLGCCGDLHRLAQLKQMNRHMFEQLGNEIAEG